MAANQRLHICLIHKAFTKGQVHLKANNHTDIITLFQCSVSTFKGGLMLTFRGKNSSYFCKVVDFGYVMDLCFKTNLQEWKGVQVKEHFGISLN